MPQPALRVSPASWTLSRMLSMESRMVPDTVQLMVEVAGLCSSAPALEVTRPAGIAPWRRAHRNRSYHSSRFSGSSTSAKARATRFQVSSTVSSTRVPSLALRRYFLSQMSAEASCTGISVTAAAACFKTVFILELCLHEGISSFFEGQPGLHLTLPLQTLFLIRG